MKNKLESRKVTRVDMTGKAVKSSKPAHKLSVGAANKTSGLDRLVSTDKLQAILRDGGMTGKKC